MTEAATGGSRFRNALIVVVAVVVLGGAAKLATMLWSSLGLSRPELPGLIVLDPATAQRLGTEPTMFEDRGFLGCLDEQALGEFVEWPGESAGVLGPMSHSTEGDYPAWTGETVPAGDGPAVFLVQAVRSKPGEEAIGYEVQWLVVRTAKGCYVIYQPAP